MLAESPPIRITDLVSKSEGEPKKSIIALHAAPGNNADPLEKPLNRTTSSGTQRR
jgi:hypothetical protein